jgi:hypothetical protein
MTILFLKLFIAFICCHCLYFSCKRTINEYTPLSQFYKTEFLCLRIILMDFSSNNTQVIYPRIQSHFIEESSSAVAVNLAMLVVRVRIPA